MYRIKGRIQQYNWGGKTFIPGLLNIPNSDGLSYAEYWLGAHPSAPAEVLLGNGATTTLHSLVNSDKPRHLGNTVSRNFNTLPFLLKVLDVKDMLSIQVHPNKQDAESGFVRENALGISIDSPIRNYKDSNHKPEVMIALSEFWLLHGFSPDIAIKLDQYQFLRPFSTIFHDKGIAGLYSHLMKLPQENVDSILIQHLNLMADQYEKNQLNKSSPDFWAAKAYINANQSADRGIFSIYLFNLLRLEPGQGIFQGARMPHAYLEGQNIELMANSDNVLRAGLTSKHMDIPELLANTDFVETYPSILSGNLNENYQDYPCPVNDFSIAAIKVQAGTIFEKQVDSGSIVMILTGEGIWKNNQDFFSNGFDSFFIDPGEKISFVAEKDSLLFLASVPI
jgi:mannose-6-phosphate isomerase